MAKTKTPFFSFGSQGSVGESVTTQRRGRDTVVRKLPLPTDPYSLPQAYQRWLYQDYAYLWTLQTPATKQQYQTSGTRYHLTAFQNWMKYHLSRLSYLSAYWKMDINALPTTPDDSPNSNTLTVYGASPSHGIIDQAFYLDGLNDFLRGEIIPFPGLQDPFTCEGFIYWQGAGEQTIINNAGATEQSAFYVETTGSNSVKANLNIAGAYYYCLAPAQALPQNIWHHVCLTWDGTTFRVYIDGVLQAADNTSTPSAYSATRIHLGRKAYAATKYLEGILDHWLIWSLPWDLPTIQRHSERRYP